MKATSLSINLAGGCNARCPFCISDATWATARHDNRLLREGLSKALAFARYHQVDTVLITGSGEPTLHRDLILRIVLEAQRHGIPITELQTNGALLARDPEYLEELDQLGLATIALSVAACDPARSAALMGLQHDYLKLAQAVAERGMLARISLNLIDEDQAYLAADLGAYADRLAAAGVKQFTLRELGIPDAPEASDEAATKMAWVRAHAQPHEAVAALHEKVRLEGQLLRTLSYGAAVYDYHGLSVCVATCMTENPAEEEIRSLILMPDGHIYHSWNYRGSVLV